VANTWGATDQLVAISPVHIVEIEGFLSFGPYGRETAPAGKRSPIPPARDPRSPPRNGIDDLIGFLDVVVGNERKCCSTPTGNRVPVTSRRAMMVDQSSMFFFGHGRSSSGAAHSILSHVPRFQTIFFRWRSAEGPFHRVRTIAPSYARAAVCHRSPVPGTRKGRGMKPPGEFRFTACASRIEHVWSFRDAREQGQVVRFGAGYSPSP